MSNELTSMRVDLADNETKNSEIDYWISKEMGNAEGEYKALLKLIYSTILNPMLNEEKRKLTYNDLRELYEENFKQLGYEFPACPSNRSNY